MLLCKLSAPSFVRRIWKCDEHVNKLKNTWNYSFSHALCEQCSEHWAHTSNYLLLFLRLSILVCLFFPVFGVFDVFFVIKCCIRIIHGLVVFCVCVCVSVCVHCIALVSLIFIFITILWCIIMAVRVHIRCCAWYMRYTPA